MEVACQKNALCMRIAHAARAHDEHAHDDQWCALLRIARMRCASACYAQRLRMLTTGISLAHPMRILAVIHCYECTDLLDDK